MTKKIEEKIKNTLCWSGFIKRNEKFGEIGQIYFMATLKLENGEEKEVGYFNSICVSKDENNQIGLEKAKKETIDETILCIKNILDNKVWEGNKFISWKPITSHTWENINYNGKCKKGYLG